MAFLALFAVLVIFAVIVVAKSVALVPQAEAAVIERLGRYSRTISGQLTLLVPFIDRVRARVDLRERVVSFPPQPVITEDNLTLNIDTVVYFQVTVIRRPRCTRSATTSSASSSSPRPPCATWSAA